MQQRAALADEPDGCRARHARGERRVEAGDGVHDAQAVGADDADPGGPGLREDLALQLRPIRSDLLEPGGDDDRATDPLGGALGDQAGYARGRGDDHREVDGVGDRGEVRVGLDPEDAGALRVDREDRAAERAADEVPEHVAADAAGLLGGADHGDRARPEDGLERLAGGPQDVGGVVGGARG